MENHLLVDRRPPGDRAGTRTSEAARRELLQGGVKNPLTAATQVAFLTH
jgi:hypothetical protein